MTLADYQSHDNTEKAGEGLVAFDLIGSTEVPGSDLKPNNPAVYGLHGRCLLSLTPGNHAYIHRVNSFRSEYILEQ